MDGTADASSRQEQPNLRSLNCVATQVCLQFEQRTKRANKNKLALRNKRTRSRCALFCKLFATALIQRTTLGRRIERKKSARLRSVLSRTATGNWNWISGRSLLAPAIWRSASARVRLTSTKSGCLQLSRLNDKRTGFGCCSCRLLCSASSFRDLRFRFADSEPRVAMRCQFELANAD